MGGECRNKKQEYNSIHNHISNGFPRYKQENNIKMYLSEYVKSFELSPMASFVEAVMNLHVVMKTGYLVHAII
jgi:hypothetical protein